MTIKPIYVTFEQEKMFKEKGIEFSIRLEQWQVVEWLIIKHNIFISVIPDVGSDLIYTYKIYSVKIGAERCIVNGKNFHLPQEAYTAAFDYVLNNLI